MKNVTQTSTHSTQIKFGRGGYLPTKPRPSHSALIEKYAPWVWSIAFVIAIILFVT